MTQSNIRPASGKLGILTVGLGAVSTTFITGVLMARKGLAKPIGSMTQMDRIRVSREGRTERLAYGDIVPLAPLSDIVFGAWDAYPANALQSALFAEVLKREDIMPVKDELEQIRPMAAAFDRDYARRIDGSNVVTIVKKW